jgi:hypothetical protein
MLESDVAWLVLLKRGDCKECVSFGQRWDYLSKSLKRVKTAEIDADSLNGTDLEEYAWGATPGLLLLRGGENPIMNVDAVQLPSLLKSLRAMRKVVANGLQGLGRDKRGFFLKAAKPKVPQKEAAGVFGERVINSAEVSLVYFNSETAQQCTEFAPDWVDLTKSLKRIRTEQVSLSTAEGRTVAQTFGIDDTNLPALLLFAKRGSEPQSLMSGELLGVKKLRKLLKRGLKGLEKNPAGMFLKGIAEGTGGSEELQNTAETQERGQFTPPKPYTILFEKSVLESIKLAEFSGDFQKQREGVQVTKVSGNQHIEVYDQIVAIGSESVEDKSLKEIEAKLNSASLPVTVHFTDRFWRSQHIHNTDDGDLGWEGRSLHGCGGGNQLGHLLPSHRGGKESKPTAEDGERYFYWFSTSPMGFGDRMRIFYGKNTHTYH